ncbi:MAG: hypothetical protein BroJett030_08530 [Alphaproteobacteria bacterium]|nr:MAG: hypothetical protein BroJett030_08530 [Alphaproteobacteria bacterium]
MSQAFEGEIAVDRLDDVVVSASGELFKDSRVLPQSYPPGYAIERRSREQLARAGARAAAAARRLPGEWLFVTDRWSGNYYHWLCEALPRLEVLAGRAGCGRLLMPRRIHDLSFVRQALAAWPGLEPVAFSEDLRVDRLVVAGHVAPGGHQHAGLTALVACRLKRHFGVDTVSGRRRLHTSRRAAARRRLANEAELAPALARHGFETVVFEEMDLAAQIELSAGAAAMVGVHGAGLANMMFMAAGGTAAELRQAKGPPDAFVNLAATCGHAYRRLDCRAADARVHVHASDIVADAGAFDALLASIIEAAGGK